MKVRIVGQLVDAEPRIPARIARKRLIVERGGRKYLILDSGFTGSVAISEDWANRLELRYAGIQPRADSAEGRRPSTGPEKRSAPRAVQRRGGAVARRGRAPARGLGARYFPSFSPSPPT